MASVERERISDEVHNARFMCVLADGSIIFMHYVAHGLELAVLDAVITCSYLSRFEGTVKSIFKFYFFSPSEQRSEWNREHLGGRCRLLQWYTSHKVVSQEAYSNMFVEEAPSHHCHASAAQTRSLGWARAASQRYSEGPTVREIPKVSLLYDGRDKGTFNPEQDLPEWWTVHRGCGYQPSDYAVSFGGIQTRERTPLQEVHRELLWGNHYSEMWEEQQPRSATHQSRNLHW